MPQAGSVDVLAGLPSTLRVGFGCLDVRCEGGETLQFALSPATARFLAAGSSHGARLELLG